MWTQLKITTLFNKTEKKQNPTQSRDEKEPISHEINQENSKSVALNDLGTVKKPITKNQINIILKMGIFQLRLKELGSFPQPNPNNSIVSSY